MTTYLVASSKEWFANHKKSEEYRKLNIIEISKKEDLNLEFLEKINPKYIFFPHWNWKVDSSIYHKFECVVFHTAPLPYGRGGSPIQNLIIRDFDVSPVCALKMTDTLDGGPIYKAIDVSLSGKISEIFARIAVCVENLILEICSEKITPVEQSGRVLNFKRLSCRDNELLSSYTLKQMYDRVRMVDGEDYPKAFINFGDYAINFSNANLTREGLTAHVTIVKKYK